VLVAGAGVLRLLGGWHTASQLPRRLGTSYLVGLAAVGVVLQLLLIADVPFTRVTVVATCLALALLGLLARSSTDAPGRWPRPRGLALLAGGLALGALALLAVDLWWQPLGQWDAWAQWTAKARSLVLFDGIDTSIFGSDAYRRWNPDYPTLVPAIEAADFGFMGEFDTRAIHVQFWLVLAGFLLALVELLVDRVEAILVWSTVLLLAVAPAVHLQTAWAQADLPVAVFFALAGVSAWIWLAESDRLALRLACVFSAGALATKFEGRIFVAALFVVLLATLAVTDRRRLVPTLAAGALTAGIVVVPWAIWTSSHGVSGIFSTSVADALGRPLLEQLDRIPVAAARIAREANDPSWLLAVPLFVVACVLAWRIARHTVVFAAATAGVAVAGLVFVYWTTPLDPSWHLDRSARRVVVGPLFFVAAMTPLLLSQALEGRRSAGAEPARARAGAPLGRG
jgi:hypothetical protein